MSSSRLKKRVCVVTTVHNRRETTLQCLRSLAHLETDAIDLEIIVVDDGSTDGTAGAVNGEFPDVEVLKGDGNLWFTGGMNVGLEAAIRKDIDFVLAVNDDSIFQPDCLRQLVQCAETHPRSVVGPLLLLWDQPHKLFQVSPEWSVLGGGFRHWRQQTVWTVPSDPWEVDIIVGNCVLFPVEAIRQCGLMDSRRHPHWGDAEYTPRMRRNGWRLLIEPKARVFCQPNDPPPRLREMSFGQLAKALLGDLKSPHSLRRRLLCNLDGAPNKMFGLAAFGVFLFRVVIGRNFESSWADRVEEGPLSERFAARTVKR